VSRHPTAKQVIAAQPTTTSPNQHQHQSAFTRRIAENKIEKTDARNILASKGYDTRESRGRKAKIKNKTKCGGSLENRWKIFLGTYGRVGLGDALHPHRT